MRFSQLSPEVLQQEYLTKGRSDRDIASEYGTYPNAVRRLRLRYGIPSRDKEEAQKLALKSGRHPHPTKGSKRNAGTKEKISDAVADAWAKKSDEERTQHAQRAKLQWDEMGEYEKEAMRQKAAVAVREAAEFGSKLERFLHESLLQHNYEVHYHKEDLLPSEKLHVDLYLPKPKVAIEVDGIAHFEPIWGEEYLAKRQAADLEKTGLILSLGLIFIRIKQTKKSMSDKRMRDVLTDILKVLDEGGESRLVEIEVK